MGKTAAGPLRALLLCGAVLALLLTAPAGAGADAGSLYQGPGPRPGPDILYEPLVDAPQLQNTGDWNAPPILVSGASAYRDGEFLYQDFLYDDSGAIGSPVSERSALLRQRVLSPDRHLHVSDRTRCTRTTRPTSSSCASSRCATATAFRITLNTLKDPEARPGRLHDRDRRSSVVPRPFPTAPTSARRRSSS